MFYLCVPVTIENGIVSMLKERLRISMCGCHFRYVTYVTSGQLDHLPNTWQTGWWCHQNQPTTKRSRTHRTPTRDHGWVGWKIEELPSNITGFGWLRGRESSSLVRSAAKVERVQKLNEAIDASLG